jgi:hypothetical protein
MEFQLILTKIGNAFEQSTFYLLQDDYISNYKII